ncbi:CAP domain-containing protein [Streptomyces durhamensis]|uniref:CAP domain-containing protein n=1 Tax=Streptomyces durhamensis TaxID=68194 RepID=UPI0004CCBE02|nr:CAP domain-containing protein [Streptomyces durhamensis]
MGRHRRIAAGRAASGRATEGIRTERSGTGSGDPQHWYGGRAPRGIAPYLNPEAYAEETAKAHAYLFAAGDEGPAAEGSAGGGFPPAGDPSPGPRRRKRAGKPVRTGLLGVSAAVALGTAAVATGVVPGLQNYKLGGTTETAGGERAQAAGTPSNTAAEQGGTSGSADTAEHGTGSGTGTGTGRNPVGPESPRPSVSASASKSVSPTPGPSKAASEKPAPTTTPSRRKTTPTPPAAATKSPKTPKKPTASSAPVTVSARAAAEAEVLKLVNQERAKVGCSPLAANSSLTRLAESFSDDMAARDFFDHTDPNGKTPWDRAAAAGVTDLGGENIARGQADAAAVVQAWMNSPGHRANILNCDFKTLGVGVHFGPGGPWWTQDFGY